MCLVVWYSLSLRPDRHRSCKNGLKQPWCGNNTTMTMTTETTRIAREILLMVQKSQTTTVWMVLKPWKIVGINYCSLNWWVYQLSSINSSMTWWHDLRFLDLHFRSQGQSDLNGENHQADFPGPTPGMEEWFWQEFPTWFFSWRIDIKAPRKVWTDNICQASLRSQS